MKKAMLVGLIGLIGVSAVAKTLFFDPFDYVVYDVGGTISRRKGGIGFSGGWDDKSGSKGQVYAAWNGLTFGDMPVSGSAMTLDMSANAKTEGITVNRPLGRVLESGSLWISFLYKYEGDQSKKFIDQLTSFVRIQSAGDKTIRFRMTANSLNSGGISVRQSGDTYNEGDCAEPSLADENVYLLIAEFPGLGTEEGGAPVMWAINTTGYSALKAKGGNITPDDLTANCVSRAVGQQAPAILKANDIITFGVWAREENSKVIVIYDELRGGTELADVLKF